MDKGAQRSGGAHDYAHVVFAERRAHRLQHDRRVGMAAGQHIVEGALGRLVPVPGVVEGLDLRLRLRAARRCATLAARSLNSRNASGVHYLFYDPRR